MKTIKERIDCEISNISIDDRYYSFEYKIWRNGELIAEDVYENDYEVSKAALMDTLQNGYAASIAIIQALE